MWELFRALADLLGEERARALMTPTSEQNPYAPKRDGVDFRNGDEDDKPAEDDASLTNAAVTS